MRMTCFVQYFYLHRLINQLYFLQFERLIAELYLFQYLLSETIPKMGCLNTNPSKSPKPKSQFQQLEKERNSKSGVKQQKSFKLQVTDNIRTTDSLPEEFSIEIPWKSFNQKKETSAQIDQLEEKLEQKPGKSYTKRQHNKTLKTQDTINPEKNIQANKKNNKSNNLNKQIEVKASKFKIDNSSIPQKKISPKNLKRTKSEPKDQKNSDQHQPNETKTKKRVRIQFQQADNSQQEQADSFNNLQRSRQTQIITARRSPRGKSCNLFKTFEDDMIEDQERDESRTQYSKIRQTKSLTQQR